MDYAFVSRIAFNFHLNNSFLILHSPAETLTKKGNHIMDGCVFSSTRANFNKICHTKRDNKCVLPILHVIHTQCIPNSLSVQYVHLIHDLTSVVVQLTLCVITKNSQKHILYGSARIDQIYRIPCRLIEGLHGTEESSSNQPVECCSKSK